MYIRFTHREEGSKQSLFIEYLILALFFLLLIPIGVLVVTKDALPGEPLYTYKIQIETSVSSLVKGTPLGETWRKIIVGRRLQESEAVQKLDKNGR